MLHSRAHLTGQITALTRLGLTKHANDLAAQVAAAEAAAAPAAAAKAPGLLQRLGGKIPAKAGLGLGALVGAGMLGHQMGQQPRMEVVPSAPIAPMFP
jgi:hypothetical protein